MKFKNLIAVIVLFAFLATCFPFQLYAVSVEEAGKIESAMPDEAAAVPKKDRKMLVFSLCEGFKHSCVPYWEKVLEVMSEKTGAFECEFSKDMSVFNAQNLKRFDAVCLNNTTHLKFNDEQRKAFMNFIKGGKGLVGIHAATDNFYDWPEAAEMMGGQFTAHPWTAGGTWAIKIDDPGHVLMKPFEGKGFKVKDEIYQTKAPLYSRQKQRVLMSLDMADDATRNVKGFEEGDEDTGITWVKDVGRGRLFYCSLGHNHHLAWEPAVLEHYLLGIQFAMGDLDVDTEPIASDTVAGAKLAGIMKKISAYDYGQSREALTQLTDLIRDGHDSPALLKEVEKALTELLRSKASLAAKQFACRQLSIIGTEDSVDTLTLMLRKEDTADMALFAMERIPSEAVDEALRKSVPLLFGKAKVGVINTLGVRGDGKSVSILRKLAGNSDSEIAAAAISALGRIGSKEAAEVLCRTKGKVKGSLRLLALDAYLSCAEGMSAQGQTKEAQKIYSEVYESDAPVIIRIGALRGMVYNGGEDAGKIVVQAIAESEPQIQSAAFMLVSEIDDSSQIEAIAAQWSELSATAQVQLMTALANKGDSAALDAVTDAAGSENPEVKIAALKALGSVGDASNITLLAATAAETRGAERNAARESLYNLSGAGINDAILQALEKEKTSVQVELIRSIGQRGIDTNAAVAKLVKTSGSKDKSLQTESLKSLRVIAGEEDMASLVGILKSSSGSVAKEAEKTVVAVGRKAVDKDKCNGVILEGLKSAQKPETKASLLGVLGKLGNQKALPELREALNDKNEKVTDAAIRALSEWPDTAAIEDVLKIAETTKNKKYRVIALRGYVRMAGMSTEKPVGEQAKMYQKAMSLASSAGEKKAVLAGLGGVESAAALELAASCLDDKDLQQEAELAVVEIAQSVFESSPEKTKTILKKVLSISKNDDVREEAQEILDEISGR
jgi:type 1 glutamine amidotransferase/HEAT repeat protein